DMGPYYQLLHASGLGVITPGSSALEIGGTDRYSIKRLLSFKDEEGREHTTAAAITLRDQPDGPKLLVMSDADWLSNEEINKQRNGVRSQNSYMLKIAMGWLSDHAYPIHI